MGLWDRIGDAIEEAHKRTLGSALDRFADMKARRDESALSIALIALSAKIARADGFVTDNEVAAFKKFFAYPPSEDSKVRMIFDLAPYPDNRVRRGVAAVAKSRRAQND